MILQRIQVLSDLGNESCFLWGPRQTGKTTLLKSLYPKALHYNLLRSSEFERLNKNPHIFSEEILASELTDQQPIIVDEVQKLPTLLDEVHYLIEEHKKQFILCGSSARKLKKGAANLLGGRALRFELFPLVSHEIPSFDLLRALNHGLIPRHYLSDRPRRLLQSYVGDYLKEEILAEALTRNIQVFRSFLESAAFSNGEEVNYQNIASECGISSPSIKEYFQILIDTLVGDYLPSYQKRPKRRVVKAPRFYFFDVGLVNYLLKRENIVPKSEVFGKAFEHFIFQEIRAHKSYSNLDYSLSYWKTTNQSEVDFILGDHEIAVEVKATDRVQNKHLKGLKTFRDEYTPKKAILVSLDTKPRRLDDNFYVWPWNYFLEKLWGGDLLK